MVIVASNRDTFDSVALRVEAAGGDTARLYVLPFFATDDGRADPLSGCPGVSPLFLDGTASLGGTDDGPAGPFDFEYVNELLSLMSEGALVVVDSVAVRLARRGAELREETLEELRSWAVVARRWRVAVLVVTGGLPPNPNRAFAALASCGVAGSIWALHRDENSLDDRRYLVPLRSARASDATSLVLRIRAAEGAEPGAVARVEWRTPSVKTAEALVLAGAKAMRGGPQGDAKRWLLKRLADGPVAVSRLESEVEVGDGEAKPFSWRTVLRAMSELSISSAKIVSRDGKAHNEWSLPSEQWQAGQPRLPAPGPRDGTRDPQRGPLRDAVVEKLVAMRTTGEG